MLLGLLLRLRLGYKLGPTDIHLSTLILEVHFFLPFLGRSVLFLGPSGLLLGLV